MRFFALALTLSLCSTFPNRAADLPKPPATTKEHEWLKQFTGEWITENECVMEPGKPPLKCKGTESTRMIGDFWLVSDIKSDSPDLPMVGQMTVGFDPKKKKYVSTWVCSMSDTICHSEGTSDGKILTLETEMPDPVTGKMTKMKDVFEMKDKDTKMLTSFAQTPDGKWVQFMTMVSKRKK